jgi:hypothetical protein
MVSMEQNGVENGVSGAQTLNGEQTTALPSDGSTVKMKGLPFKASADDVS